MKDTQYPLRLAVNSVLAGNIIIEGQTINLYDEKKKAGDSDNLYIIFGTQQSTKASRQFDQSWFTDEKIDLEIFHKTGFEVTKDLIDEVSNRVYELLMPTRAADALPVQDNMQIQNFQLEQALTRAVQISPTETVVSKIMTFSCQVIQQI